jgi:hypothetical protein
MERFIQFGIDLTVRNEDSVEGRRKSQKDFAQAAEEEKNLKYKNWFARYKFYVLPFVITSRGTLGNAAIAIFDLYSQLCRRRMVENQLA